MFIFTVALSVLTVSGLSLQASESSCEASVEKASFEKALKEKRRTERYLIKAYHQAREEKDYIRGVWAYLHLLKYQSHHKLSFRTRESIRGVTGGFAQTRAERKRDRRGILLNSLFALGPSLWVSAADLLFRYPYQANRERVWEAALSVGLNEEALESLMIPRDDFFLEVLQSLQEATHELPGTPRETMKAKEHAKKRVILRSLMPTLVASVLAAAHLHPVQMAGPQAPVDLMADDYLHVLNSHPELDPTGRAVTVIIDRTTLDQELGERPIRLLYRSADEVKNLQFIDGIEARAKQMTVHTFGNERELASAVESARTNGSELVYFVGAGDLSFASAVTASFFPAGTNFIYLSCYSGNCAYPAQPGAAEAIVKNHQALAGSDSIGFSVMPTGSIQLDYQATPISRSEFLPQAMGFSQRLISETMSLGSGYGHLSMMRPAPTPQFLYSRNGLRMFSGADRTIYFFEFDEVFPDELELKESLPLSPEP